MNMDVPHPRVYSDLLAIHNKSTKKWGCTQQMLKTYTAK